MPYIKQYQRDQLDPPIALLIKALFAMQTGSTAGHLNYAITRLVLGTLLNEPSYLQIATATGVLENVKQELYRRVAVPYEREKCRTNGEVYPPV